MIESLRWIVTPFEQATVGTLLPWFVGTLLASMAVGAIMNVVGVEMEDPIEKLPFGLFGSGLAVVVVGPILEETLFRGLPMLFDMNALGVVAFTLFWVVLHKKRSPAVLMSAPVYIKLALGGHLLAAYAFHMVYNGLVFGLYATSKWAESKDLGESGQ